MKILLTGKNGQVGYELERSLACLGDVIATDKTTLNLEDNEQIRSVIQDIKPDLIVNGAAYTAVDKAEKERGLAHQINAVAPGVMAEQAAKLNIPLIHYSTDYVFHGQSDRPWTEEDMPSPVNHYGQTKLDGEVAIQQSGCNYLIFRTSWVYGNRGYNFYKTMERFALERADVQVVDDQFGTPTWCRHIADVTLAILFKMNEQPFNWERNKGVYHLVNSGMTSWNEFAKAIFELLKKSGKKVPKIDSILTKNYPMPALRPNYSCLSTEKLANTFDINLPDWHDSLKLVLNSN